MLFSRDVISMLSHRFNMRIAIFSGRLINYAFSRGPSSILGIASSSTVGSLQSALPCRTFLGFVLHFVVLEVWHDFWSSTCAGLSKHSAREQP